MELAPLSEKYGAFYVPAFQVLVSGRDLTHQLAIDVTQVEVDLSLGAAGRFSFVVGGAYDLEGRAFVSGLNRQVLEVLTFGATVEIKLGYGDRSNLPVLFSGVITEISTSFPEGGTPELTVAGYDHAFTMTLGKQSRSWKNWTDTAVVVQLAAEHGLEPDIEPTLEQHAQIEQNQESDFEFMKKLADRNHCEFYVTEKKALRFARPRDGEGGVVTLRWGQGLLSFRPEANLAAQVSKVEVYGWDSAKKQPIVGRAGAGEESGLDPRRIGAGARLRQAVGRDAVLQLRQPVFTEAEAKRRAEAVLSEHAKRFVTGEAECVGLPTLRPDCNVDIAGLGAPFSKTYYVQQTVHKIDANGYRTRLKVKETSL